MENDFRWQSSSMWRENNPPTPIKVLGAPCCQSAACAFEWLHRVPGCPRLLLKTWYSDLRRGLWTGEILRHPGSFTSVPSSQSFPGADIIAEVKHIWTMTDVFRRQMFVLLQPLPYQHMSPNSLKQMWTRRRVWLLMERRTRRVQIIWCSCDNWSLLRFPGMFPKCFSQQERESLGSGQRWYQRCPPKLKESCRVYQPEPVFFGAWGSKISQNPTFVTIALTWSSVIGAVCSGCSCKCLVTLSRRVCVCMYVITFKILNNCKDTVKHSVCFSYFSLHPFTEVAPKTKPVNRRRRTLLLYLRKLSWLIPI